MFGLPFHASQLCPLPMLCLCAQEAGVAGSSATYATLCDVFAKQGKWDKLRTAVQVKGEWAGGMCSPQPVARQASRQAGRQAGM